MDYVDISKANQNKFICLIGEEIKDIKQFYDSHYEKEYDVYLIETVSKEKSVLKKVSLNEYTVNKMLKNSQINSMIPNIFNLIQCEDDYWLFSEYIEGENLTVLNTQHIKGISSSLATISSYFYLNRGELYDLSPSFDEQLENKYTLLNKLAKNSEFYSVYHHYIKRLTEIPLTLSHDDLLPLNVLSNETELKIVDWEYGRINSYVTDLTRFCCFYYSDESVFKKGFGFLGHKELIDRIKNYFYLSLSDDLKQIISYNQFLLDYELEEFNQNLLNLMHLEKIDEESVTTEWEVFFYNQSLKLAESIISKTT